MSGDLKKKGQKIKVSGNRTSGVFSALKQAAVWELLKEESVLDSEVVLVKGRPVWPDDQKAAESRLTLENEVLGAK